MDTLKLINTDELGAYAPAKWSKTVSNTVMPGDIKTQVSDLKKQADTENKPSLKEKAQGIEKAHTFSVQLDFTRLPINKILELATSAQSIMVSLQNGLLRPAGSAVLQNIASGAEGTIEYAPEKTFSYKNKVLYVTVHSWLGRPKAQGNGKDPVEKSVDLFDKMSPEQQELALKRLQEKMKAQS